MQFMQIAVIQMGSMFELNKVFLKVYADILEKYSDVDAVCITVYKKVYAVFYTASTFCLIFYDDQFMHHFSPIYDQNM